MNLHSTSFLQLLDNAPLAWGLIACGSAQFLKLFFELLFYQRWRPAVLFETGGMPSSHSALVTATASGVGLQLGFSHPTFALAATIAFGMGIERLSMLKYGITDMRGLFDLNLKWLDHYGFSPLDLKTRSEI